MLNYSDFYACFAFLGIDDNKHMLKTINVHMKAIIN